MHSLRARITILVIGVILICVGTIGYISISSIRKNAESTSTQYMTLLCDSKTREMNEYMESVRQSVDIVTHFLMDDLNTVALVEGNVVGATGSGEMLEGRDWDSDLQKELDDYLHAHVRDAQRVFHSVAFNTNNAVTYYYRLNPELSREEKGFLFSRVGYSDFAELTPTDILAYDKDDDSHVIWYYHPIEKGRPSWIAPYRNDNLGMDMISYVTPIYKAGSFIGVVGMDISYETLIGKIMDLDIYETGYAFLTDKRGAIVYHPDVENGKMLTDVNNEFAVLNESLYRNEDNPITLVEYNYNGTEKRAASQVLDNELRLVITAPVDEINAGLQQLIRNILITTAALVGTFIFVVALIMRHITEPLQHLTVAAKQISEGNYDVELPADGRDEVGTLTDAFRQLVDYLRIYINDLNSKAYKDPLTRVKNKAAYDIWVLQINERLKSSDELVYEQFAILMFDCNLLKEINDRYGHQRGDAYLQKGCWLICNTFVHSPVFRIGGDEFVVILEGEEYKKRKGLMKQFQEKADEVNAAAVHPWEKVNMAMGCSLYNPRYDHSVESVYKRADKAMYANKRAWKETQENQ